MPAPDSAPSRTLRPEDLVEHLDWLRRLSRALVASAPEADDIAQETVRRALEGRRKVHDVRRYLAGVARNVRREMRRRARPRLALDHPVEGRAPASDEVHEHLELLRVILAEIDRLPDAQRRVVYAMYVDGQAPAEIAAEREVAVSTVRANVARGLERIRRRLDAGRGSRAAWTAALGPWAFARDAAAAAARSQPIAHAAHPIAPKAAASAAGLLSSLSLAMLAKFIVGAATLAAAVFFLDPFGLRHEEVQRVAGAAPEGPDGGSRGAPAPAAELVAPESISAPRAAPGSRAGAPKENAGPPYAPDVRFVDAETGEPVPSVALQVHSVEQGRGGQEGKSGDDGRAVFEAPWLEAGEHAAQYALDDWAVSPSARMWRKTKITVPGAMDLEVRVGPTFTVSPDALKVVGPVDFDVYASGPGIRLARRPQASLLAGRGRPGWLRFARPFGEPRHSGPWTLQFRSFDGLWAADHPVDRRAGIEPTPLDVAFERRGVLEFALGDTGAERPPLVTVQVEGPDGASLPSVQLRRESLFSGLSPGNSPPEEDARTERLPHLPSGTYTWSAELGAAQTGGSVEVAGGQVVRVAVELDQGRAEARYVSVAVEAAGDPDLSRWQVQFFSSGGGLETIAGTFERDTEAPGNWRVPVPPLPAGRWNCAMLAGPGFRAEPKVVQVGAVGAVDPFTVRELVELDLVLTVDVDAALAADLAVYHADGVIHDLLTADADGRYRCRAPADHATAFYVGLPGHALAKAEFDPGRTSTELSVRPVPGTRTRAVVLDPSIFGPREGVEVVVNGQSVGRTDAWGEVWFEPSGGVVESVALGAGDAARFALIASPSNGMPTDHGYSLVVAPK